MSRTLLAVASRRGHAQPFHGPAQAPAAPRFCRLAVRCRRRRCRRRCCWRRCWRRGAAVGRRWRRRWRGPAAGGGLGHNTDCRRRRRLHRLLARAVLHAHLGAHAPLQLRPLLLRQEGVVDGGQRQLAHLRTDRGGARASAAQVSWVQRAGLKQAPSCHKPSGHEPGRGWKGWARWRAWRRDRPKACAAMASSWLMLVLRMVESSVQMASGWPAARHAAAGAG